MRYDIEINITDILDNSGKEMLSNMLFADTSTLAPAIFNRINVLNIQPVDLTRFKFKFDQSMLSSLSPLKYISRVMNDGDFSLSRLLIKHGKFIPFLNPGTAIFYNYPVSFSYSNIRKNINFVDYATETQPVCCGYNIQIPEDVDYSTIKIFSVGIPSGEMPQIENEYTYIDSDIVTIDIIYDKMPEVYHKNKIIINIVNEAVDGVYSTLVNRTVRKLFSKDVIVTGSIKDSHLLLSNNGMALVDIENNVIINRKNDKLYNLKHQSIFTSSPEKNLYLVDRNPIDGNLYVFLNTARMFLEQQFIEKDITFENPNRYVFFDKYPISNVGVFLYENQIVSDSTIGIYNSFGNYKDNNNYEDYIKIVFNDMGMSIVNTGILKDSNGTPVPISIAGIVRGTIMPIITFSRKNTYTNNSKQLLYDISVMETNFTNGTICLASNELSSNTVGTNLEFIFPNGQKINWLSSIDVKVKLTNKYNYPVPNKIIDIKLDKTLNDTVLISSANSSDGENVSVRTNINGEGSITLSNMNIDNYAYIQKEWVAGNKIMLPFKLNVTDPNNIFLFMITGDDPLQAQLSTVNINGIGSDFFEIPKPYDYYNSSNDLSSYYIEGRKIAYVSLQANERVSETKYSVISKFIKPLSINVNTVPTNFFIRNCYIYDLLITKYGDTYKTFSNIRTSFNSDIANFTFSDVDFTTQTSVSTRFDNNWLINNSYFTFSPIIANESTEIVYNVIPGVQDDNVIGYFIRYIPDENTTTLTARYSDGNFNTTVSKTSNEIEVGTSVASENPLTLSTEPDKKNSYLGPYSYLTLTEYLNSNCESTCTQYICKYSGAVYNGTIGNRCMHPTSTVREFYLANDESNLFCKHTTDYDLTLLPSQQCPGLDEQLINPFLLYSE